MPIKKILKITGFIFVPLLPMVVAIYFLFPYINEKKYQKVTEKYKNKTVTADTSEFSAPGNYTLGKTAEDSAKPKKRARKFHKNVEKLNSQLDSLQAVNDSLEKSLVMKEQKLVELKKQPVDTADANPVASNSDISEKEFSENIKSLLDLDVENLTPIVNQMSDQQLVRIFEAASGLNRKKLLKSLESDRAAKLMTEVL